MSEFPEYKDKIVAFLDILGFESLIFSLSNQPELHKRINRALEEIKATRDSSLLENTAQSNLEVKSINGLHSLRQVYEQLMKEVNK